MEQQAVLTVSWTALTAIGGLLVIVVGMATGYLRLFTQNQLAKLEKNIMNEIKREFQNKEIADKEIRDIRDRLARLEGTVFPSKL